MILCLSSLKMCEWNVIIEGVMFCWVLMMWKVLVVLCMMLWVVLVVCSFLSGVCRWMVFRLSRVMFLREVMVGLMLWGMFRFIMSWFVCVGMLIG